MRVNTLTNKLTEKEEEIENLTNDNNYLKCDSCNNINCDKIKIWTAPYKNTKRTKLLYSDKNYSYIIILEKNKNDMYIISSYLIDEPGYLNKIIKEYNKYKKTS